MSKNNFQLIHVLNKGPRNATVYAGISNSNPNNMSSDDLLTIKITDFADARGSDDLVLNEITNMRHLRHSNIIPLISCFVKDSQIWCIYPFMYYGSCKDILNTINDFYLNDPYSNNLEEQEDRADEQIRLCFNEQSLQPITKSVLSALEYLHSKHIIHRSVCPENILISQTGQVYLGGLKFCISLIDQGLLAKKLHDFPSYSNLKKTGSNEDEISEYLNYLSPELLQQNLSGYNTKSDIYSLAVTLCELANGVNPFVGCEKAQMLYEKLVGFDIGLWDRNILTSPESKKLFASVYATESPRVVNSVKRRLFSEKFRNFVDLCALRTSELRPSASQLLQHAYLKKVKLQNVTSTLRVSVISDGIIELQKKLQNNQLMKQFKKNASPKSNQTQVATLTTSASVDSNIIWEF